MDDRIILNLYREGAREQAFNLLVREYGQSLYWHIRKIVLDHDDANDLLQNTYIKAWDALDTFREDSKLYTWLFRIATNEVLNFLRRKKLLEFISFGKSSNIENKLFADTLFNGDKMSVALQNAIAKLPARQKVIFNMRYFDEKKYEEIAQVLEISEGAAKASYHHAHEKVKKSLINVLDIGD